jgi:hypothetical protein
MKLTAADHKELDALRHFNDVLSGAAFMPRRAWRESGYCRYVRAGLVEWGDPPEGFDPRRFAGATITPAGRSALSQSKEG